MYECLSLDSKFLASDDSEIHVMIGAGDLTPHLIKTHLSARPSLRRVIIWNRAEKGRKLAEKMRDNGGFDGVSFESNGCLGEIARQFGDITCEEREFEGGGIWDFRVVQALYERVQRRGNKERESVCG